MSPPAPVAPSAFTQKEAEVYNSITPQIFDNGDVAVTIGNKRVIIGRVSDEPSGQQLVFEYIRKNKIKPQGN